MIIAAGIVWGVGVVLLSGVAFVLTCGFPQRGGSRLETLKSVAAILTWPVSFPVFYLYYVLGSHEP